MRPRRALAALLTLSLGLALALAALEVGLRLLGLGDPVLYDNRRAWGYRPRPDQERRRLGGARVHVNNLGTRGPEVEAKRPAGVERLLFLGDSVTWGGSYVDESQLFSNVAGETLAAARGVRVEALDAGVNAWGAANILGLVTETGGFDSTVWVVTALEDDFRREKVHAGEVPYFDVAPHTAIEELAVLGAYALLTRYKAPKPDADLRRIGDDNVQLYKAVAESGRLRGARVLLVWHPTAPAVAGRVTEPHRDPYLALAADTGATTLDLTPAYAAAPGAGFGNVYEDGLHLSITGHRIAGEAIGRALAQDASPER